MTISEIIRVASSTAWRVPVRVMLRVGAPAIVSESFVTLIAAFDPSCSILIVSPPLPITQPTWRLGMAMVSSTFGPSAAPPCDSDAAEAPRALASDLTRSAMSPLATSTSSRGPMITMSAVGPDWSPVRETSIIAPDLIWRLLISAPPLPMMRPRHERGTEIVSLRTWSLADSSAVMPWRIAGLSEAAATCSVLGCLISRRGTYAACSSAGGGAVCPEAGTEPSASDLPASAGAAADAAEAAEDVSAPAASAGAASNALRRFLGAGAASSGAGWSASSDLASSSAMASPAGAPAGPASAWTTDAEAGRPEERPEERP